jgi:hypothetical protein
MPLLTELVSFGEGHAINMWLLAELLSFGNRHAINMPP